MFRVVGITGFLLLLVQAAVAQKGGESTYSFLGLSNAARVAALGGEVVSIRDDDINLVFHNPGLLTRGMHNNLNLNYVNYFAGVNYGYVSYGYAMEGIGTFAAGIHYINYGTFDGTDELGIPQGSFKASEYALNLIYSRVLLDSALTAGINLKPIFSSLEQYTSFGVAVDLGVSYYLSSSLTTFGLVIKNFGTQITSYTGQREPLPFEIQAGVTQGLAHAPFRFTLTFQHLERWDLTYRPASDEGTLFAGNEIEKSTFDRFGDKLMRHVVFGTEFLIGENFHVDLGYNYKRRQELKVNARPGLVGFSLGFGFRVSKFHIAYGWSSYHLAGGTNHFSLTTNLSEFYKQKNRSE